MRKVKLLAPIFIFFLAYSCATVEPKYREGEPESDFKYPVNKEIEKSFYLIGDAGYSPPGGTSLGLVAFKTFLDSVNKTDNYTIFLGDNIYPDGMPPKDSPEREAAEYRLDAQLDAIENYKGKVVFIPGNHDWYNEKLEGLERQKEYLKSKFEEILLWSPDIGCGIE
ncbi:MAG: metallophosphoesterase, partial [Gramella sp.]|nr:metallophosphoesterase [Christiangramia sp.]